MLEDRSDADLVLRDDPEGATGLVASGFSRIAHVRRVGPRAAA